MHSTQQDQNKNDAINVQHNSPSPTLVKWKLCQYFHGSAYIIENSRVAHHCKFWNNINDLQILRAGTSQL